MARKIKLTRPELKRQRDALARFTRFLPMLKLKQQQLQFTVREVSAARREALDAVRAMRERIDPYRRVLRDGAGLDVEAQAQPEQVRTTDRNVAGVHIGVFESVSFPAPVYSLFGTPPWVDRALADLRQSNELQAKADIVDRQYAILRAALTKIIQRVNLFEKVLVPQAAEAIRRIRIHLGEEQTAAVGRAKLAKSKLAEHSEGVLPPVQPSGQEGPT